MRDPTPSSDALTRRLPCAKCRAPVEPLRAARVRLIANRFFYFCSQSCAENFTEDDYRSSPPPAATFAQSTTPTPTPTMEPSRDSSPLDVEVSSPDTTEEESSEGKVPTTNDAVPAGSSKTPPAPRKSTPTPPEPGEATNQPTTKSAAPPQLGVGRTRIARGSAFEWLPHGALVRAAIGFGAVSIALLLAVESQATLLVRSALATTGALCLALETLRGARDEGANAVEVFGLPLVSALLAVTLSALAHEKAPSATAFAAMLVMATASYVLLWYKLDAPVARDRKAIHQKLERPPTRLRGGELTQVSVDRVRPGEEIIVHAGETISVDVTVTSGRGEVRPWLDADVIRTIEPGDSLYAGARLHSGQLRATVRWTGLDRQWERLVNDPRRRADLTAPIVQFARKLSHRGALVAALSAIGAGLLFQKDAPTWLLHALALGSAFLNPALYRLAAIRTMQTVLAAQARGIAYRSASVLDTAGRISTAAFCARGTLLLGEPELSTIESFSELGPAEVLALVAGAEQHGRHPIAMAVSRAARARGVRPDAVRTPQALPGLGVTAVASNGKHLVVGSRALMLKERISVARAEQQITELEATGRTVLLVALAHRLVGLLALQDGLRAGARAAVQHLLDVGIEPVLLSGDARETCEALGRTIDIDHIRPEILPSERGQEIERLTGGGATVAVVGRSPTDDIALAAASVAIALPSAGNKSTDFDIELASDEVQKAAVALRFAHRCRTQALRAVTAIATGATLSCLLVIGLSMEAAVVPIVSALSTFVAGLLGFSSLEGRSSPPQ